MPVFDTGLAQLPLIAIAVPIIVAALLLVTVRLLPRPVVDGLALVTAAAVITLIAVVLVHCAHGRVIPCAAGWASESP